MTRVASIDRADDALTPRPLKVMVIGLRGIVDVEGGIETHARMLYPLLARLGCDIEVVQRSRYYPRAARRSTWRGIRLTYLWSPKRAGLETAAHTLLGVLYAAYRRPDVLHLHAIGPALLAPLARCLGLRVVMTHHSVDYQRDKFGALAKAILRAGERLGVRYAHHPIVVSPVIRDSLKTRFGLVSTVIPNGAPKVRPVRTQTALDRFGLQPRRYVLCVARVERAKRQHDLIDAFERARLPGWKLAIVGGLDDGAYCTDLAKRAAEDSRLVLTGFQSGTALRELYTHAGVFVLPSTSEGHPIALLEALSYGLPALASANEGNLTIPLPNDRYFPVGDTEALARLLQRTECDEARGGNLAERIRDLYSWRSAAHATRAVYDRVRTPPVAVE
jgi:glycosyltransferase involved in cell wall biosynthesis